MQDEDIAIMGYLEYHYWYWKAKKDLFRKAIEKCMYNPRSPARLYCSLDVGCGGGALLGVLRSYCKTVYGIDKSEKAVEICRKNRCSNIIVADAENMPFKNKFDLVTASDILEHCDDRKAIKSIYKAMKPESILIVTVPMFKHLWGQDDDRLKHKRRYTKKMLKNLLKDFEIIKMSYIQTILYFPALVARTMERITKPKKSVESYMKDRIILPFQRSELGNMALLLSMPYKSIFFLLNYIIGVEQYIENRIALNLGLPFGVGMIVIARKKK